VTLAQQACAAPCERPVLVALDSRLRHSTLSLPRPWNRRLPTGPIPIPAGPLALLRRKHSPRVCWPAAVQLCAPRTRFHGIHDTAQPFSVLEMVTALWPQIIAVQVGTAACNQAERSRTTMPVTSTQNAIPKLLERDVLTAGPKHLVETGHEIMTQRSLCGQTYHVEAGCGTAMEFHDLFDDTVQHHDTDAQPCKPEHCARLIERSDQRVRKTLRHSHVLPHSSPKPMSTGCGTISRAT